MRSKLFTLTLMAFSLLATRSWAQAPECGPDEGPYRCEMTCVPIDESPAYAQVTVCGRTVHEAKVFAQPALLLEHGCTANAYDGSGLSTLHTLSCSGCTVDWCNPQGGILAGGDD